MLRLSEEEEEEGKRRIEFFFQNGKIISNIKKLLRMAILHMDIKESINAQIMRGRKKDIYTTPKRKSERKRNI